MDAAIIEKEALLLGEAERAILADHLVESLTRISQERIHAWANESDYRLDAHRLGKLKASDANSVIERLRKKLH
jgi:hypothetical protein